MARILVFAGSARRDSLNKKLAREAARLAREAGAEATFVDLDDYPIPLFHGDLEAAEGMPENARKLRALFLAHDALLVASPENNSSVTALLKNTIDWLSRDLGEGRGDDSGLAPWRGKVAGLMAASPGAFGGVRGLPHLRQVLATLGVTVLGTQVAVPRAHEAFGDDGRLVEERVAKSVRALAEAVAQAAGKLHA
ncbi:MAG TPA: NAD(P)H-dependent oxidoreductase [Usitatibacteraceae bacterium]|jgi:NAD(P)H-dependent FMN reductase|nr:NAD(P)H-dependent oxidoreductase [Burkholderiales bacterium]HQW38397.1 NAD(P)H-dependent oxidoreductase [Usitatibacteraceae bacterium]HRA22075.1 NAD(P)H-dependent oxidoreductase [Usitatibacteraceae bacterium]